MARYASTIAAIAVLCAVASPARADLAGAFTETLRVDTAYVTGASGATDIAFAADGRAVVTTKKGQVVVRRANGTLAFVPYPFGGTLDADSEKGLLGVVADPNVAQNHRFYFYVSNGPEGDKHRVYGATLTASDTLSVDPKPIVALSRGVGPGLEGPMNHDGGGLFIHGGKLYVGVGDTGMNATPPTNKYASCLDKGNGKILRVNLDGSIPSDNPLVGVASVTGCSSPGGPWTSAAPDQRIFAWGLRNPWRFWIDPKTSLLWIGDVGESTEEEISVGGGNRHYGYPFVEGSKVWGDVDEKNCTSLSPARTCTAPQYSYTRREGVSVTGGLVPSGCGWSDVFSTPSYVFGDNVLGWIRALPINAARTGVSSTTPVEVGSFGGSPVSFRMGPDAALYVVFYGFGAVYRFAPREGCTASAAPSGAPRSGSLLAVLLAALGVCSLVIGSLALRRRVSNHGAHASVGPK